MQAKQQGPYNEVPGHNTHELTPVLPFCGKEKLRATEIYWRAPEMVLVSMGTFYVRTTKFKVSTFCFLFFFLFHCPFWGSVVSYNWGSVVFFFPFALYFFPLLVSV